MQFLYIHEVLRLLLNQSNRTPETFIAIFNQSDSLIAFNYSNVENRFTHVSHSFKELLGYNPKNILNSSILVSKIIHPHDILLYKTYFTSVDPEDCGQENIAENKIKRLKFRARHIKGYWKYFILFSMNYWNDNLGRVEKIGLIADEHTKPQYQMLSKYIDGFSLKKITSDKDSFLYDTDDFKISQRESEILEMIGEGQIAKEIATHLHISPNTVITHRKNLISKFHVRNTAQLIKKASQLMLI